MELKYKQAYRVKYDGKEGIGWRGPFSDEITIFFDDNNHAHCRLISGKLIVIEEVYVSTDKIPGFAKDL